MIRHSLFDDSRIGDESGTRIGDTHWGHNEFIVSPMLTPSFVKFYGKKLLDITRCFFRCFVLIIMD